MPLFYYKYSVIALIAFGTLAYAIIPPIAGGDEVKVILNISPIYQYSPTLPQYAMPYIAPVFIPKPVIKQLVIDLAIISSIESGNDKSATNGPAKGAFQMKREAWDDAVKVLGKNYSYDSWYDVRRHTKEVADCYFHKCIPAMLKSNKIPVNLETTIGAYNYGATNLKVLYRKYGRHWIKRAPMETQNYIDSYKNLYVDKNN